MSLICHYNDTGALRPDVLRRLQQRLTGAILADPLPYEPYSIAEPVSVDLPHSPKQYCPHCTGEVLQSGPELAIGNAIWVDYYCCHCKRTTTLGFPRCVEVVEAEPEL